MVALGARYEIWRLDGVPYQVPALEFQTGPQQTILRSRDVLRKIFIPGANLEWQVSFQRLRVATAAYALSIVVGAFNAKTGQVRFGLGACVPAPRLVEFACLPTPAELADALDRQLPLDCFVENEWGSALYRRQMTEVLMQQAVWDFGARGSEVSSDLK